MEYVSIVMWRKYRRDKDGMIMAEVNEHGVFPYINCEKVELKTHPKFKAIVILAECNGKWYASYEYKGKDCGGGCLPSMRQPYDSRELALQTKTEWMVEWLPFPILRKNAIKEQFSLF